MFTILSYVFVVLALIEAAVGLLLLVVRIKDSIEEARWEKAEKARREKAMRESGLYKLAFGPLYVECIDYTKD